jgi:hypothetical protein
VTQPFQLTGVVHLIRPVHRVASNLDELRDGIESVEHSTLFYHAVQFPLRAPAEDELPPDDFSAWVHGVLQDREAAERLALARLEGAAGPEALRAALVAALDAISPGTRRARVAPEGGAFPFLAADSVPVSTGVVATDVHTLFDGLIRAEANVWFHELIECAWWEGGEPAIVRWLHELGETRAEGWVREAAHSGRSIAGMRRQLLARWRRRGIGRRVADAAQDTEDARREAGRTAIASLVKRLKKDEEPA